VKLTICQGHTVIHLCFVLDLNIKRKLQMRDTNNHKKPKCCLFNIFLKSDTHWNQII